MRHHKILLVPLVLVCNVAFANDRISDAVIGVIDSLKQQHLESEKARIVDLKDSYLSTSGARDRKLMSLALGVHYLETDQRLANQYLNDAEKACGEKDELLPIIKFFLAQAKLKAGLFSESVEILEGLLVSQSNDAWRKAILGFLIENHFASGNYEQLAKKFRQYSDSFTFGKRQESLARIAVSGYEKRGDFGNATEVLEELARSYPTTEDSRWAFKRLVDYNCEVGTKAHYDFSDQLLLSISRNVAIDDGLRDLIVNLVYSRIRLENQAAKYLSSDDRAELFFRLRFYDDAAAENARLYETAVEANDQTARSHYAFQTGRSYFRQRNMLKSAEWFSRFIVESPRHKLLNKAHELLGDSLKYLGLQEQAAGQFATSIALKKDKLVQWERFWSTYRSGDFKAALSQLEGKNALVSRASDDPQSLPYWHGRILEKIGKQKEANSKFLSILAAGGDSYYANLVAIQHSELLDSAIIARSVIAEKKKNESSGSLSLAAKSPPIENQSLAANNQSRAELRVVDDLLKVGLKEIASMQLASIRWGNYNQEEAFSAVSRIAWVLDDYQSSRRIRSVNFSQLRNLPTSFNDYISHQARNPEDWKIYYPMAFEKIVEPVSKSAEVDPFLILSIMRSESFYNKEARSSVGALGLMQLMPYTAVNIASGLRDFGFDVNDLLKPEINIGYGGYYLGRLIRYYGGNAYVAAAAYNAGPAAVNQWLEGCRSCSTDEFVEMIPYRETRRYVREVMKTYSHYRRVYLNQPILQKLPALPEKLPTEAIF